jgi:hypothetical protein
MRGCSRDFAASKRVPLGHSSSKRWRAPSRSSARARRNCWFRLPTAYASRRAAASRSSFSRDLGSGTKIGKGGHHRPPFFFRARTHDSTSRKAALALICLVSCRMDRTKLQRQLELATTHIARGEEHIARQHQSIWELEQDGQDTTEAWCLLTELEAAQALHVVDRDRLIKVMADKS